MASPLVLLLILLAGSAQCASNPGTTRADINSIISNITEIIAGIEWANVLETIQNVIANIPDLIDRLAEIIAGIDWANVLETIQNVVANIPDLIDRLPEIIANLPGDLPEIIADLIDRYPDLIDRLREILASISETVNLPDIIDRIRDFIDRIDWDAISAALPDINWAGVIENLPEIIANLPDILENLDLDWPAILEAIPITINRDPGEPSSIQEFPSLVQVEVGYNNYWLHGCTGNILNTAYLLSSGRCFSGPLYQPSNRRVRAGANTRGGDGAVYQVSYSVAHPTFGDNGFDGDLAVIRILGIINYGPNVQPISITSQGVFFPAGVRLVNAGWGSTAQGRNIANRDLFKADLYVVDNWQCTQTYAQQLVPITVTYNMVCAGRAGSGGRMADLRDAGGPLYYNNVLIGVLSFGRYLGNDSLPVVATSISSYTSWIVSTAA